MSSLSVLNQILLAIFSSPDFFNTIGNIINIDTSMFAVIISYLGMKSWDLHVCHPRSHMLIVLKKVIPDTTRYDFA